MTERVCVPQLRKDLYRAAIMGFAVGDALGAPAEFGERWMRDMDPVKEMRNGGVFDVPVGGWTDDTSMVLAALESLRTGFDQADMMDRFVSWYRTGRYTWSGQAIGVGKQILKALETYEITKDINTCGGCLESDNGNGALMRILPVCLYGYEQVELGKMNVEQVVSMIHQASALTHAHARSQIACGLYYFMSEAILNEDGILSARLQMGLDKGLEFYKHMVDGEAALWKNPPQKTNVVEELQHYHRLFDLEAFSDTKRDDIRSTGYVVDTLEAAVWCLITTDCFEIALLKAVNLGLDTDTIAAIAGGLAGLYYGYEAIPAEWRNVLQKREMVEAADFC